jgi:hypothetical protein
MNEEIPTSRFSSPPLPDHGDDDEDTVFLGVGKVISAWETIEFELSRLYSVFSDDPDGETMRGYARNIFSTRLDALIDQASQYFTRRPSQQMEGAFRDLCSLLRRLAQRRNEIAHGFVFNIEPVAAFNIRFVPQARGKPQYAVIAPYYSLKQHDPDGLPAYAYNRAAMEDLIGTMATLFFAIQAFRKSCLK